MTTPTTTLHNPLLLPEVLNRVAHFVYSCDEDYWDYHPEAFLPCLLVCRFWHDCFLPHLYSTFISGITNDGSPYHPHSHHLRTFVTFKALSDKELPYHIADGSSSVPVPAQLTTLRVHQNAETMLDLLSANAGSRLRVLTWTASKFLAKMPPAMVRSLANLSGLVTLELDSWKIDRADFLQILAASTSTLEILSLRLISGYGDTPFLPVGSSLGSASCAVTSTRVSSSSLPIGSSKEPSIEPTSADNATPSQDSFLSLSSSLSSLSIQSSLPPLMRRLSELRLVLDWHQSPAAVYLVQLCPSLQSLYLDVDVETSDWPGLISNLRTFCPRLESIEYKVGYSMEYEEGCYIESSLYASLLRDSTVEGQLRRVVLGVNLDDQITEALLKHSDTLEEMNLVIGVFEVEQVGMICRLLAGCRRLKEVDIQSVSSCEARDLVELTREVWACRELKSLTITGYQSGQADDNDKPFLAKKKKIVRKEEAENEDMLRMFAKAGQGWYVKPSLREKERKEAVEDIEVKQLVMVHIMESGLEQVERVQFNESKFYSDERYFSDDEGEDESAEEGEE